MSTALSCASDTICLALARVPSRHESLERCSVALGIELVSLFSEIGIGLGTIITIISRGESTTSNLLFLCASLLITIAVAVASMMGTKRILQALRASGKRVPRISFPTAPAGRSSAPGRSAPGADKAAPRCSALGATSLATVHPFGDAADVEAGQLECSGQFGSKHDE